MCGSNDGVGGGDPNLPDDIVSGNDNASTSESAPDPSSNLSGSPSANGSMISITWWAYVAYQYNYTTKQFINVNPGAPYPVPVSQPFTDDNGNPAVLYCSTAPDWKFKWYPLTLTTMYAIWDFVGIRMYVYTTGTISLSFDLGMSKVCATP